MSAVAARVHAAEPSHVRLGVLLFIASETALFGGFFAAYFALRGASATWPPTPELTRPELPLVGFNTLLLLSSSLTLQLGVRAIVRADRRRAARLIGLTLALGAAFLAIQVFEFSRNGFGIGDGVFGSTFYTLTGFHGAHVSAGLLAIGALLRRTRRGLVGAASEPAAEAISYYWHFVDVVWLFLFTTVYVL